MFAVCLQKDVKMLMTDFELSTKSKLYVWLGANVSIACSEAAQAFDIIWHMGVLNLIERIHD